MKIHKNVEVPKFVGRQKLGEASRALMEWYESDDVNIKFECGGKEEANRVYSTVSGRVRTRHLNARVTRSGNDIYVVRKAD